MSVVRGLGLLFVLFPLILTGCGGGEKETPKGAQGKQASPGAQGPQYDFKGKVVSVAADKKAVTLDHEEIPGAMMAMKMQYAVENPQVLEGLKAGDAVQGKMKKEGDKYVVTQLQKR